MFDDYMEIITVGFLMLATAFCRKYRRSTGILKYLLKFMAVSAIIILIVVSVLIIFATYGYFVDKNYEIAIMLAITGLLFIPSAILLIKNFIKDIKN
ncbi:Hypothetical protein ING2D1G_0632 [Peptoniphilus sp. ING2-D1G]|nr:Hypothetical protein ING2D1G_0632 [Peptoniphilus sp. ING2-D1G]